MAIPESTEMGKSLVPDLVLDLKGLVCPVPVVKLANAIKEIEVGGVVEATATDPGVLADIPAWCRASGNELLAINREGKVFVFRVRRSG
jgi:tRNA 2-thiouridine synthesizing protein A